MCSRKAKGATSCLWSLSTLYNLQTLDKTGVPIREQPSFFGLGQCMAQGFVHLYYPLKFPRGEGQIEPVLIGPEAGPCHPLPLP